MNYPKISIVTPSFNQGQFLEQTIVSVLDQSYPNLEYIIIDGGSKDNSVDIIKKYEKHLVYWISTKDTGQSDAINKGLKRVTGEVFNWLNSDDYYCPGALRHIAECFANPNIYAVCGKSYNINPKGQSEVSTGSYVEKGNLLNTIKHAHIEQPSTFFTRSAIDRMGYLSTKLHYIMDKEWWLKYLFNFGIENIVQTDTVLVNFRIHEQSKTMSGTANFYNDYATLLFSLAVERGLNQYADFLSSHYNVDRSYKFDGVLPGADTIKAMLNFFLIHTCSLVFNETDFDYTREVLKEFSFDNDMLSAVEKDWLAHANNSVKTGSWLMFKLRRKWHHLFNKS